MCKLKYAYIYKGLDNCCSQIEKKIEIYPISEFKKKKMKKDINTDPNSLQNRVLTVKVNSIPVLMQV